MRGIVCRTRGQRSAFHQSPPRQRDANDLIATTANRDTIFRSSSTKALRATRRNTKGSTPPSTSSLRPRTMRGPLRVTSWTN